MRSEFKIFPWSDLIRIVHEVWVCGHTQCKKREIGASEVSVAFTFKRTMTANLDVSRVVSRCASWLKLVYSETTHVQELWNDHLVSDYWEQWLKEDVTSDQFIHIHQEVNWRASNNCSSVRDKHLEDLHGIFEQSIWLDLVLMNKLMPST